MNWFLIVLSVAFLLFRNVGKHLEQASEVQMPDIFDAEGIPEDFVEKVEDEGASVFADEAVPEEVPAVETSAEGKSVWENVSVTPAVSGTPAAETHRDNEKLDPKKLIIYSEILRPKFLE